jgi:hypothetical protein
MLDQDILNIVITSGLPIVQALGLSLVFSMLPGRFSRMRATNKGRESIKAQIIICMAGAAMTTVIGTGEGSSARAFALLGIGSFIRFRTAVKSPADTAILFLLIIIGMACGVGYFIPALLATMVLMAVVFLLERWLPTESKQTLGLTNKDTSQADRETSGVEE